MSANTLNPVQEPQVQTPLGVVDEIDPKGMEMTLFPEGKRRLIHVIPPAIKKNNEENGQQNKLTTVAIVEFDENGIPQVQTFHAALLHGQMALKWDTEKVIASVCLVTYGKIMAYTDPNGMKYRYSYCCGRLQSEEVAC